MISWAESDRLLFLLALAAYALAACLAAGQLCRQGQRPYKMLRLAINSGLICNGTAIVTRTVESGHLPFANMYEFGLVFVFATVILSGIFARRYKANNLNAFIMPIVVILASTILISYHASRPLVPALKSYWLFIHVATAVAAYGALATACAVAIMYLWKYRLEKNEPNGETGCLSLSLEQMEMMADRLVSYAMPCLTLLIITGAIWAEYAWGKYWQWDPKETWSLITWVIYAIYLHGRRVVGWRGVKAMWLLVIGFIAVLITFVGINLLKSGLHAYF